MMTMPMITVADRGDAELVQASLAGNREAFGQIVARYQSLVCSLTYSATGSLSQSEDLAQETFITAWKHLAELREPAKLRAWLCGVARNLINSALRAQGREPSHRAEALDGVIESPSPEPLPAERVIRQEETEILWRALERIPETYRVPLVLFYREHQSVEVVAQSLELTEDNVKQRLSRGRKMLQDEVVAFVEGALAKTAPGKAFTLAVVAALPFAVTSIQAATVGAAAVKGGAGAKSAFTLGSLGGLLGILGAVAFSWKNAVEDAKSPRERRLMMRMGWWQMILLVVSLAASFYGLPQLAAHPVYLALALAFLILVNAIVGVLIFDYLNRRRLEIGLEEGAWADPSFSGPEPASKRMAFRKTLKTMVPFLLLLVVGSVGLPWKQHGGRCAVVVLAELLILGWAFCRFLHLHSHQFKPNPPASRLQQWLRKPVVLLPTVILGSAVIGVMLPMYLNPGAAKSGLVFTPWLRSLAWCMLGAVFVYALFAMVFISKRKTWMIPQVLLDWFPKTTLRPEVVIDQLYAPLVQQLNLTSDQAAQLKDLVLKKTQAQVRISVALMYRRLDAAQREKENDQLKMDTENYDAQIQQVLGAENFPVFKQFEKSVPDRTMLDKFHQQLAGTERALSTGQQDQLLQALSAARAQFPWTTDNYRMALGLLPVKTYERLMPDNDTESFPVPIDCLQ